jgi:ribosomal protein S18 acetylase RimI-like enzyme
MLSNLRRKANSLTQPATAAEYRLAREDEVIDGLSLILAHDQALAGPEQVGEFVQFAAARGIDLYRLWLAGAGGQLSWAVLPVVSPGKTMLLLSPPMVSQQFDAAPLVESVCRWAGQNGVHLAQVLADPAQMPLRQFFARCGFREIAELHYLQSTIRATTPPSLPPGYRWMTYSSETHPLFARALAESYQNSLDCPALGGLREIEDVIAGHRASGEVDEQFWYVLLDAHAQPRAVLLLTRVPKNDLAELVYLGLSPSVRGRGISDILMRQAFWAVRQMNLSRITLAVDSLNAPALRLYYRHGLSHVGSKAAMIRDLRNAVARADASTTPNAQVR